MGLNALKKVLDEVALGVDPALEGLGLLREYLITFAGNRAAGSPVLSELPSEELAVEALVSDSMDALKSLETHARSGEAMAVADMKNKIAKQADFIHAGQPLGSHAAAREADGLLFTGGTRSLKAVLVYLDIAAIDIPLLAHGLPAQPTHQGAPDSAEAPSPELRIDSAPKG